MLDKAELKMQYSEYSSEYLLQMRAKGELLVPEAQAAIQEILTKRGEHVPPIPSSPIVLEQSDLEGAGNAEPQYKHVILLSGMTLLAALVLGISTHFAKTWVGVVVAVATVCYLVYRWLHRASLSQEEREAIEEKTMPEIMACAAAGKLSRIQELVQYGGNVNTASVKGGTPLMFATRNNHVSVVEYLLSVGADQHRKTEKGRTALDIARSFSHSEIVAALEKDAASKRAS